MEATKSDETLAHTQADYKDELRLKEKCKSSLENVHTPVIVESGDKSIFEYQLKPANELSTPLTNGFGGINFLSSIFSYDTISEEECDDSYS